MSAKSLDLKIWSGLLVLSISLIKLFTKFGSSPWAWMSSQSICFWIASCSFQKCAISVCLCLNIQSIWALRSLSSSNLFSSFFTAFEIVPGVLTAPYTVHCKKPATPPIGFATTPISPLPMPFATPVNPSYVPPLIGSVMMPVTPSKTPFKTAQPP